MFFFPKIFNFNWKAPHTDKKNFLQTPRICTVSRARLNTLIYWSGMSQTRHVIWVLTESDSTQYCAYTAPRYYVLIFIGWPVSPGWVSNIFLRRFKKCLPEVKKVVGLSMIRIISYQSHVWFHETIANKREDLLSRRKVVEWWKLAAAAGRTKI